MAVPVTIPRVVSRGVSRYVPSRAYGGGLADALIGSESQGLAIDFTDLSMVIRDTGTPANNFSGNPNSKLTYTAPSTKWILGANGLYSSGTTLRTEYNTSGIALGVRIEEARTNVVLHNRDLTNAAWTKTNTTAAKDQTGIDGVANSASSLTATAGNGTCLQAITLASSARYQSAFVKRITGSGTINMTMDNGTTWTAVTVTASWTKVEIPTQTLANPTVGFRIVTSGDAIAIDMVGNENGTFSTSPIVTAGSTVTRASDLLTIATTLFPYSASTETVYARFTPSVVGPQRCIWSIDAGGANDWIFFLAHTDTHPGMTIGGPQPGFVDAGTITAGVDHKIATAMQADDLASSINGGAVGTDATTGGSMPAAASQFRIGNVFNGTYPLCGHVKQIMYLPRRMSNADMQTLTT